MGDWRPTGNAVEEAKEEKFRAASSRRSAGVGGWQFTEVCSESVCVRKSTRQRFVNLYVDGGGGGGGIKVS